VKGNDVYDVKETQKTMFSYDLFEDIKLITSGIPLILQQDDIDELFEEEQLEQFKALLEFCRTVLNEGENSKHFQNISPMSLERTEDSQGRAVTIDPDHATAVKASIVKAQKVFVAGFVAECSGGKKYKVINMNHRHEQSKSAIVERLLPATFTLPVVIVPFALAATVGLAIAEIQDILNSGLPKKLANSNDCVSSMTKMASNYSLDLSNEKTYEAFVKYYSTKFPQTALKTIKSNATRVHNKKALNDCSVWCANTKEFVENFTRVHDATKPTPGSEYYNFSKDGMDYKNCKLQFISTKGSCYDQAFRRDINFNFDEPGKKVVHLVGCQVNKGDPQTTIKSRATYFTQLYKDWLRIGKYLPLTSKIGAELVIIVPQNEGQVEIRGYGADEEKLNTTETENKELKADWRCITRQEIYAYFNSGDCLSSKPYKTEWLFTEAREQENILPFEQRERKNYE
jgi:hypothetical protein|tara:strand:+ start:1329 stop:2699 length:1371 start_codon:yes stop_codon:yes gene_type:complete